MGKTKIDWTDETINPFTGCNGPHGTRCPFCYAHKMAKRLAGMPGGEKYRRVAQYAKGDPFAPAYHIEVLASETKRLFNARKSRRVFVMSMGDMCFEGDALFFAYQNKLRRSGINTAMVQTAIAGVCAGLSMHTFQILTKRPDLLRVEVEWPSNVWLGVSVSRGSDERRITTLKLKGKEGVCKGWHPPVLWGSVEPLLDPGFDPECLRGLDWVVIGAKTGGRKGVDGLIIRAAQRIVEWCEANDTPCFVKDNMRRADPDYDWPREFPAKAAPATEADNNQPAMGKEKS